MKKALLFIIALLFLLPFAVTGAYAEGEDVTSFALVETDTGPIGGSVNYFVLRPLMEYDDEGGIARGKMFGSLIFSLKTPPDKAERAEAFITDLFKEGACISAADTVAEEMKADGILDKDGKYPIYVSLPYPGSAFDKEADREGFCKYFIDTLYGVFSSKNYAHISLDGIYLSDAYDAAPSLRSYCIRLASDKGLDCVAATAIGGVKDARVIASSNGVDKQLEMKDGAKGYSLHLGGVPDDKDRAPYTKLMADYNILRSAKIGHSNLLFSFRSYNDVYDCASAMENTVPNPKGRSAYELLREIINCPFDGSSAYITGDGGLQWHYYTGAVFAVLGTAGIIYMIAALYRKGKRDE